MDFDYWKLKTIKSIADRKKNKPIDPKAYKQRLLDLAAKRMKIVFAGALDEFERAFSEMFAKDKAMHEKWKAVRHKILNNGNNQSRLLANDIEGYNIGPKIYNYHMLVKPEKKNEEPEGNR